MQSSHLIRSAGTATDSSAGPSTNPIAGRATTPQRLYDEWHRLCRQPRLLRRVATWGLPGPPPDHLDEVLTWAGFSGAHDDDAADAVLRRLVTVSAHDDFAARVVLQRILPGIVSIARRRGKINRGGHRAAFDEAVAAAWVVIRTYPVDRRPKRLAANMLRDIEYQGFVRGRRLRWAVVEIPAADIIDANASTDGDPGEVVVEDARRRLDELLRQARDAGVAPAAIDLIDALGHGRSPDELATELGISDRSVRSRRRAAINKLQRLAAA